MHRPNTIELTRFHRIIQFIWTWFEHFHPCMWMNEMLHGIHWIHFIINRIQDWAENSFENSSRSPGGDFCRWCIVCVSTSHHKPDRPDHLRRSSADSRGNESIQWHRQVGMNEMLLTLTMKLIFRKMRLNLSTSNLPTCIDTISCSAHSAYCSIQ